MSSKATKFYAALAVTLLATALSGCGSGNREGAPPGGTALFGSVATVGDTACVQCHSATADPVLSGQTLVSEYQQNSPHNQIDLGGCESCHGGGAMHNGVGPIPYPSPDASRCATCHDGNTTLAVAGVQTPAPLTNSATDFASSVHASGNAGTGAVTESDRGEPCVRCHSNQGGIQGAAYGLTGNGNLMNNTAYQTAVPLSTSYDGITCETCHQHGGGLRPVMTRNAGGNLVNWNPSGSGRYNDQFNLCTSCHGLKDSDGTLMASGDTVYGTDVNGHTTAGTPSVKVGHHETTWYRVIATTHFNNADNSLYGITGYVVRNKGTNPCFDCHAHEARTNTRYVSSDPTKATIYTDWAQSGHGGDLLANKVAAVAAAPTTPSTAPVDAAINANTRDAAWGGDGGHKWSDVSSTSTVLACQRCHTSTGVSNYLNSPATYTPASNNFSHLAGWSATTASKQNEMLYCWGCHSNSSEGVLRNPGAITVNRNEDKDSSGNYTYTFKGAQVTFPDVQASNTCIACHSGRQTGDYIANSTANFSSLSFQNSHYMAAAGMMYVKAGFTAFTDASTTVPGTTTTYGSSLTSTDDGGSISSTHRVFGSSAIVGNHGITSSQTNMTSGGPCVTCHMNNGGGKRKHSLAIDSYAYNNVCVNCHTTEGTHAGPVTLTASTFQANFVQPNAEAMQSALTLAKTLLHNNFSIDYDQAAYPYFFPVGVAHTRTNGVTDWTLGGTVDGKKFMGACFNINLLSREPAAYAHARTYTRRLIYDTVDWLDDKTMNLSVSVTAHNTDPTNFTKGTNAYTDSTLGTIDASTTEGMLFLLNWDRNTGKWKSSERP